MARSKIQRRWLHPNGASRDYQRLLMPLVRTMNSQVRERIFPLIPQWAGETPRADSVSDDLGLIISSILDYLAPAKERVQRELDHIFSITSSFNNRQYKATVKQMTGVDVFRSEPWLKPMSEQWVAESTRLIKSIPEKHLDEVEGMIRRGVQEGRSATYIKKQLQSKFKIPANRAKLIASDQVSKANSMMTVQRLEQIGVDRYKWRGMKDSRERPEHLDREKKVFKLSKPPWDGHPGYPIRCRCWMEAIFND